MEKLIISKQLADEVKNYKTSIKLGIEALQEDFLEELGGLRNEHHFLTRRAVSAYLLGGQERVYEVKNDPYMVVWNTENKDFYPLPYNYPLEEDIEIVISTYDILEDAEETAEELNNSL